MQYCNPYLKTTLLLLVAGSSSLAWSQNALRSDTLSVIAAMEEEGEISKIEAWNIRAAALVAPELLPPSFKSFPAPESRCLTPLLIDAYRHHSMLEQVLREKMNARALDATGRPESCTDCAVSSSQFPVTVHYRLESQESQAQRVLEMADYSWQREVNELDFSAPLPDDGQGGSTNLDIYLAPSSDTGGGAYTQPTYLDLDPNDDVQSCSTYIVINEEISDELMTVYVAHELNHACQAAMDFQEILWAWEATATFMEDEVYDDVNDYYWYIPYFQDYPKQNLVCYSSTCAIYPYGSAIFIHFLNEAMSDGSGQIASALWLDSQQASWMNEPDFLDAVDRVARSSGWSGLDEVYSRFAHWRYFVGENDDGKHFQEGTDWGEVEDSEVPVQAHWALEDLPKETTVSNIYDLGSAYFLIDTNANDEELQIRATIKSNDDTRWNLIGSRIRTGEPSEDILMTTEAKEDKTSAAIEIKGADQIMIATLNMAADDYDPEYVASSADLQLELEVEEAGSESCNCNQHSDGPRRYAAYVAFLAALAGLALRRRGKCPSHH